MTAQALLTELSRRGITALALGDTLRLVPRSALDDVLIAEARRLKPDLLRLLAAPAGLSTAAVCCWCGSALAPYLCDLAGRGRALLCPICHRWTISGGAA